MELEDFEKFILWKYNHNEMTAIEYSQINILIGEYIKSKESVGK